MTGDGVKIAYDVGLNVVYPSLETLEYVVYDQKKPIFKEHQSVGERISRPSFSIINRFRKRGTYSISSSHPNQGVENPAFNLYQRKKHRFNGSTSTASALSSLNGSIRSIRSGVDSEDEMKSSITSTDTPLEGMILSIYIDLMLMDL